MTTNHDHGTGTTTDQAIGPTPHRHPGDMEWQGSGPIANGRRSIRCIDPELIVRFFFGDLDEPEAEGIKAHFEACDNCRQKLAALILAVELDRTEREGGIVT